MVWFLCSYDHTKFGKPLLNHFTRRKIVQIMFIALAQAEINNWTNVDPTLDINFRLSESDCQRTVKMIAMYCVDTTPVSNIVPILVTNIFSTLAVSISKILVIRGLSGKYRAYLYISAVALFFIMGRVASFKVIPT